MVDNKNGNPTAPQVGPNQGRATPAVSPGNTKPSTPSGKAVDTTGVPNFLAGAEGTFEDVYNKDGFVGVDPIYQNFASHVDSPNPEEPAEEPETP